MTDRTACCHCHCCFPRPCVRDRRVLIGDNGRAPLIRNAFVPPDAGRCTRRTTISLPCGVFVECFAKTLWPAGRRLQNECFNDRTEVAPTRGVVVSNAFAVQLVGNMFHLQDFLESELNVSATRNRVAFDSRDSVSFQNSNSFLRRRAIIWRK